MLICMNISYHIINNYFNKVIHLHCQKNIRGLIKYIKQHLYNLNNFNQKFISNFSMCFKIKKNHLFQSKCHKYLRMNKFCIFNYIIILQYYSKNNHLQLSNKYQHFNIINNYFQKFISKTHKLYFINNINLNYYTSYMYYHQHITHINSYIIILISSKNNNHFMFNYKCWNLHTLNNLR